MKTALVLATLLCLVSPHAAPASDVWIEAERPAAGNFPPPAENPYKPAAFWESDALSNGDWIGVKCTDPNQKLNLEYAFEVAETGIHRLYARKFFTFGKFRWKIDDGPWQEVPSNRQMPLDTVAFRETDERVSLNWFFMGQTPVAAGNHRLHIESLPDALPGAAPGFEPIAYDAFLLTTGQFHPNGKLKPGERHDIQTASGFSFEPRPDPFADCAIDWRSLNEPVAGESGGVTVRNGDLVLRNSGEPVRFVGVNVSPMVLAHVAGTDYLARLLAKKGVNLVRVNLSDFVTFTRDPSGNFSAGIDRDRLDALIHGLADFKANGIYFALAWDVKNSGNIARCLLGDSWSGTFPSPLSPILLFDAGLQECCRALWRSVLDSKMPGGERLGSDPALALITLQQQESIFADHAPSAEKLPEARQAAIEKAFGAWAVARYGSLDAALQKWGGDREPGDRPDDIRAGLPALARIAATRDARSRDAARFLAETQAAYFSGMTRFFREDLRYAGLLSASNKAAAYPDALGWLNAWSFSSGDVTERHGNYLPHFEPVYDIWNVSAGARFKDRSALRFDPLPGQESARFDLPTRSLSYAGKPTLLTELAWAAPNAFRPEMPLLAFTQAALQDVQAVVFATLDSLNWNNVISNGRLPAFTPAIIGQLPAFSYAYRKGLLPAGAVITTLDLSLDKMFALTDLPVRETPDTQFGAAPVAPDSKEAKPPKNRSAKTARNSHPAAWTTGITRVNLDAPQEGVHPEESGAIVGDARIECAGNQVLWDCQRGLLTVDTPQFKAVGGFLKLAGPVKLAGLEVSSEMEFGVICVVSLDGQPIYSSSRLLVQAFSQESNTGSYADGKGIHTIRSMGRPPIQVQNIRGHVHFTRPDATALMARALDENGYPTVTVATGPELPLLPSTLSYLIQK